MCADLYFSFGDLVSTHLLISAAHEILEALDRSICKTGMLSNFTDEGIKPEYREDFRALLKSPYNGFKHGKKDLDAIVVLPAGLTEILIISAIQKYTELTQSPTKKMRLLRMWVLIQERMLTAEAAEMLNAEDFRQRFSPTNRIEFWNAYYLAIKKS